MAGNAAAELEFLALPPSADAALATLTDAIRSWFTQSFGAPTTAQRLAWPAIAVGKNLLLSAPTGSGKTLAAFLPIVGRLVSGPAAPGIRCLYVSPLKALATDVRRNLRLHLRGLRAFLPESRVRIGLRTGDTPARHRRRLTARPPSILVTTPESLAILLSLPSATALFAALETVVVDEIHTFAADKRGADLSVSLERLTLLAEREVQRIGLSATCAPLEVAARFLVGTSRACTIALAADGSPLQLQIELLATEGTFFSRLLDRLAPELTRHRSTLIFTNTRRLAERVAFGLRRRCPAWDGEIAVHHSALAAERRRSVERGFKNGRLRAVVSSTSLELGIDIGPVEHVVLVHPPGAVVRLLQRIGRGGHGPGRARRGLVLTAGPSALFEAAVTAASSHASQCEPLRVPEHPLDVLCQQLVGMAAARPWRDDEAFQLVRRAYPYCHLARKDFDACIAYLAGLETNAPARLRKVGDAWAIRSAGAAALLRRNVGSIVSEETRRVVVESPIADCRLPAAGCRLIGEVDAWFGEGLQAGDRFLLDGRCLEVRRRRAGALIVDEVIGRPAVPHWSGEGPPLAPELARRLYLLRGHAAEALRDGPAAFHCLMRREFGLDGAANDALARHFERQEQVSEIPDVPTLLVEAVRRDHGTEYYFHAPLNRAGNDALARVAVLRLARDLGLSSLSLVADLGFMLMVRGRRYLNPNCWRAILSAAAFEEDLFTALESSETLAERFRQIAHTGLLAPLRPLRGEQRTCPLAWFADDFVLLRQARRELLAERQSALQFVQQLPRAFIHCRWLAEVSPFVEGWNRVEAGPVETVEMSGEGLRRLGAELTQAHRAG